MLGAIIGDIVGSRFEFFNHKSKKFSLFDGECFYTDDTVLTSAIADSLLKNESEEEMAIKLKEYVKKYSGRGYGGSFLRWVFSDDLEPYNSFGNGAAMRISSVAYLAKNEKEVKELAKKATIITHNHPEGLKGAEVVAMCVHKALYGETKEQIARYAKEYYPEIASYKYEDLVKSNEFSETCQNTVPKAIYCFLISKNFEDCLRTTVSIGGDTDTLCAISCAIAEAHYGIPRELQKKVAKYFVTKEDKELLRPILEIYNKCGINMSVNIK